MRYYKIVNGDYLLSIGTGNGGEEITAEEYRNILDVIRSCPTAQEGCGYLLKTDLAWELCETHDGSLYDPIPYEGNMALVSGLYYSQDGVTYLCSRDTVNPVYNALSDLVGIYVEQKGE